MPRAKFSGTARDAQGNIISSATIVAYLAGTTTLTNMYAASSGGAAVNSVTANTSGSFSFWIDAADYGMDQLFDISLSKDGYTTSTISNVEVFPPSLIYSNTHINPIWFGVVGDGTTDDAAAFQAAIDSMSSGETLWIPPGTYKLASQLSITKSINIDAYGVTFNCPAGFASGQVLSISGSNTHKGTVSGAVLKGASSISFTTTGIAIGDWIWLVSDHADDLLEYSSGGEHNGEFLQIKTVSAGSVTIIDRTRFAFSANAEIFEENFIEVAIRGLEIVMDLSYQAWGMNISDTINFLAEDVKINHAGTGGMAFTRCLNPTVNRAIIKDNGTIANNRYGVLFQDCSNTLVDHSVIDCNNWHAVAVGGSYSSFNHTVQNSLLRNGATTAAVDFHAVCRYANILGNTIKGYAGVNIRGPDFIVENNTITADYTAFIAIAADIKWTIGKVLNNRIFISKNGVANAYVMDSDNALPEKWDMTWEGNTIVSNDGGILVWPSKASQSYDNFAFRRNYLELPDTAAKYKIMWPVTHNSMVFKSVDISDNEFVGGDEIQLNATITSLKLNGNKFRGTSFSVINNSSTASEVEILNNRIDVGGSAIDAIKMYASGTHLQIKGNRIDTTGVPISFFSNCVSIYGHINDNQWLNGGASSYAIVIDDTGQTKISDLDVEISRNRCREGKGIRVVAVKTSVTYTGPIRIVDNWIHSSSSSDGITVSTPTGNAGKGVHVTGNTVDGPILITTGINDVIVNQNIIAGSHTYNLQVLGYTGDLILRAIVNGNSLSHTAGTGMYLNYVTSSIFGGNIIGGFTGGTGLSINNYTTCYRMGTMINGETTAVSDDASGTLSTWP